jgi:hypothetical protein
MRGVRFARKRTSVENQDVILRESVDQKTASVRKFLTREKNFLKFFVVLDHDRKKRARFILLRAKNMVGNRKHEFFNFGPPFLIGID